MNPQLLLPFDSNEPVNRANNHAGVSGLTYWREFLSLEEQRTAISKIDKQEWQTELSRRVQHYGYKYDYKSRSIAPSMFVGPLPAFAKQISTRLYALRLMTEMPDQVIINEYLPGQGIAPHIDCEPCFKDTIATISLGSEYTMDLIDTESELTKHILLELGSCLSFSGEARYRWKHGIKARKSDNGIPRGRRISMTFRTVISELVKTKSS